MVGAVARYVSAVVRPYPWRWDRARYPRLYLLQGPDEEPVHQAILEALRAVGCVVWTTDAGGKRLRAALIAALYRLRVPARLIAPIAAALVNCLPKGHPDIAGFTLHGRALFIEVKAPERLDHKTNLQDRPAGRPDKDQLAFLDRAARAGCICGVAWSAQDALAIVRAAGLRPTQTQGGNHGKDQDSEA